MDNRARGPLGGQGVALAGGAPPTRELAPSPRGGWEDPKRPSLRRDPGPAPSGSSSPGVLFCPCWNANRRIELRSAPAPWRAGTRTSLRGHAAEGSGHVAQGSGWGRGCHLAVRTLGCTSRHALRSRTPWRGVGLRRTAGRMPHQSPARRGRGRASPACCCWELRDGEARAVPERDAAPPFGRCPRFSLRIPQDGVLRRPAPRWSLTDAHESFHVTQSTVWPRESESAFATPGPARAVWVTAEAQECGDRPAEPFRARFGPGCSRSCRSVGLLPVRLLPTPVKATLHLGPGRSPSRC